MLEGMKLFGFPPTFVATVLPLLILAQAADEQARAREQAQDRNVEGEEWVTFTFEGHPRK
jgi:hypothetical protein